MPGTLRFYTAESLSATSKRAWTPEKYLLCQQVPIARLGVLLYGKGEIPVQAGADGIIRIIRDEAEVFHPNAILSYAGKPLTDEHPPAKVSPDNWIQYSKGTVLNPHRGDGNTEDSDLLYADLLIQDRQTINDVLAGKVEVSAGYDAEYEQVRPGEGRQHNIIGNHVALVVKGRCGTICSIGDAAMTGTAQSTYAPLPVYERYEGQCYTGDQEPGTPLTLETLIARVGRLEHAIALLAMDPIDADQDDTSDEAEESQATAGAREVLGATAKGIKKVASAGQDEKVPDHLQPGRSGSPHTTADVYSLRARADALLASTNLAISRMQTANRAKYG